MKVYLLITTALTLSACGSFKNVDGTSISSIVPKLSQPVGQIQSASALSITTEATPVPFGCPDCANFQYVKAAMLGPTHGNVVAGMLLPDQMSCQDETTILKYHPEILNSGHYLYVTGGTDAPTDRVRIKINAPGGKLQSYQSIYCGGNDSNPYQVYNSMSVTVTNGVVNYTYKQPSATGASMLIQASGVYQNGTWTSKTITEDISNSFEDDNMTLNDFGAYQVVQESYVDKSDATQNVLLWAQLAVAGSTRRNMVLGNGSVNLQLGNGSPNVVSWTMATDSEGVSGQYQTAAAASTLPTVATDTLVTLTADESWDCTIPDDAVVITTNQHNEAVVSCSATY